MVQNFQDIYDRFLRTEQRRLGVVVAQDEHTLEAVAHAAKGGGILPVLYGQRDLIAPIWERVSDGGKTPEIVECDSIEKCITAALCDVNNGSLDCIMKGRLETADLMKFVVDREVGIRKNTGLSAIALMESPYYHKLFAVTDVGLMMYPSLEQKKIIIENAVGIFNALGETLPKVGVLAAVEKVNPKMPETVDAAKLKEMNMDGTLSGCIVEGPISYDLCMDCEAAAIKEYTSPVAGDPDILLVPNIVSGNLVAKCLTCSGAAKTCGIVSGAKVPIILTSRSAPAEDKYRSIVLSAVVGRL